jgi:hypothetical protein
MTSANLAMTWNVWWRLQCTRGRSKELIEALPAGWESHADTRHMAMELRQLAGDWSLLAQLVPAEFSQEPGEVRGWLLRVMVATRTSSEEVGNVLREAPLELSGGIQEVTQLATLETRQGYKERALRRLYVMRRTRLGAATSLDQSKRAHAYT